MCKNKGGRKSHLRMTFMFTWKFVYVELSWKNMKLIYWLLIFSFSSCASLPWEVTTGNLTFLLFCRCQHRIGRNWSYQRSSRRWTSWSERRWCFRTGSQHLSRGNSKRSSGNLHLVPWRTSRTYSSAMACGLWQCVHRSTCSHLNLVCGLLCRYTFF